MNHISPNRLAIATAFIEANHFDIQGNPFIPCELVTDIEPEEKKKLLEESVGRALVKMSTKSNNPETILLVRLNSLYLSSNLQPTEEHIKKLGVLELGYVLAENLCIWGDVQTDYLDIDKLKDSYKTIYDSEYSKIRIPSTPYPKTEDPNTFSNPESEKIEVLIDDSTGGFIHHQNHSRLTSDVGDFNSFMKRVVGGVHDRYSINVNVTQELINELDKFLLNNFGAFKFSKKPHKRHDSITYYCDAPLSKEQEIRLATIIQPYARGDSLYGKKIGAKEKKFVGIRKEVSPPYRSVQALREVCRKLDSVILLALEKEFEDDNMSTGQFVAASKMVTLIRSGLPVELF